ncbi:hypothetical protein, partial [Burkholderia sp. SIMBA_024]|uniref:hypothetical protein n=1 Tax=Burkholderia sp. SIMBA_024 TaxID=3085768 RepID=UPI00397DB502
MKIGDDVVTKRADAGHLLERWVQRSSAAYLQRSMTLGEVATIGDFTIDARMLTGLGQADVEFAVRDLPDVAVRVPRGRVIESGIGLVQR